MILKKALFLSLDVSMLFTLGCEDTSKGSARFEYGKTMIVKSDGLPFSVEFDNKFVTEEEASAVVNYYYSIAEQDEELAKQSSYPDYLEYLRKSYEFDSIKSFLKSNYETIGSFIGSDNYEFKNIKITKCFTEEDKDVYTYFGDIDDELNSASAGTSDKITSRKLIEADITCTADGKDISLTEKADEQQLYIYVIDGKPYVL